MFEAISKPFGWLMMRLYEFTNNYGIAIILFAIIVRLIMLPFQMKSKRGMMRTQLLQPQMAELQKKYGNNKQKYAEEMQKLYKEAGASPMSGCLWSLIPFPILIALYYAIREPITCMMGVAKEVIAEGSALITDLTANFGYVASGNAAYGEIQLSQFITEHLSPEKMKTYSENLCPLFYNFLGLDLGATPSWQFWTWETFSWNNIGLFLIPVIAAALTYATTAVTKKLNPPMDPSQQASGGMLTFLMPIMTLVFAFMMPAALGLYWAMGSLLSIVQEIVLTKRYKAILAVETAEMDKKRAEREAELEAKRAETERLKAMNATVENESTSKKKKAQREKAEREKAEREWQEAQSGEESYEPSRVGHRKYARGRAYDPDRYTRKEEENEDAPGADESAE